MNHTNYENTPKDIQEVIPEGAPQSLEDELEVKELKI